MLIGATMFLVRYEPWGANIVYWRRAIRLLGMFMGAAGLWGAACGLAFGLTVTTLARRTRLDQLSPRRFALWGALGGAAFPLAIYAPRILARWGTDSAVLFGGLTLGSALVGAGLASLVLRVARRAPAASHEPAALREPSPLEAADLATWARERVPQQPGPTR